MVRLTDRPDMTLDVYRGRKTTNPQQQQNQISDLSKLVHLLFFSNNVSPENEYNRMD